MRIPSTRLGLGGAVIALLVASSAATAVASPAHAPAKVAHVAKHHPVRGPKRKPAKKKRARHTAVKTVARKTPPPGAAPAAVTSLPIGLPSLPLPVSSPPTPRVPAPTPTSSTAGPTAAPTATTTAGAAPSNNAPPAPGGSAAPSPSITTTPAPTASTQPPIAIGITVAAADDASDVASYTSAAGRNPAILMWYSNWGGPIAYGPQIIENDSVGSTPMITWDPTDATGTGLSLSDIAAGDYDAYIDDSAARAKNYGKPVLLRFAHEMNLAASPYGPGNTGDTAATFVSAWQHVVTRFATDGAKNVRWVWSPNVDCGGGCPFDSFYPGDAFVDYVALDGYNYGSVHSIAPESFTQVFAESYADLGQLTGKPKMIAETATAGAGTDKAAWIDDAFLHAVPTSFPGLVAVVWFDRNKEFDWRVNADTPTLTAWQDDVVNNPAYQGTLSW